MLAVIGGWYSHSIYDVTMSVMCNSCMHKPMRAIIKAKKGKTFVKEKKEVVTKNKEFFKNKQAEAIKFWNQIYQ